MEGERISYHESVLRVYGRIKEDAMNNIWDSAFSGATEIRNFFK
jgi:hypothetical protein